MMASAGPRVDRGDAGSADPGRLVVLSYHFPPDGAVGGLRWAGLTKYLARQGWQCWVVTAAEGSMPAEPGQTIIRVPRFPTLNDRVQRYRLSRQTGGDITSSSSSPAEAVEASTPTRLTVRQYLRRELGFLLSVPDEGRGWVLRAAARARRLVSEVRPHVLVSSGPPHSAHVAAWLGKWLSGVRWLADLRDPWAGPIADAWRDYPRFRSPVFMGMNRVLERTVMRSASGVICNTREFAQALGRRYAGVSPHWVPNAVDRETLPSGGEPKFTGMSLAYVGTVYGGRDLTVVLRGFRRFLASRPDAGASSKIRVAGDIDALQLSQLRRAAAALGLEGKVEIMGRLPRDEALRVVIRSRAALVLAQQQDWQVPAKLYEMVALGIPTIVVASQESAAASEARRLGAMVVPPEDEGPVADMLAQIWTRSGAAATTATPGADYESLARDVAALLRRGGDLEGGRL